MTNLDRYAVVVHAPTGRRYSVDGDKKLNHGDNAADVDLRYKYEGGQVESTWNGWIHDHDRPSWAEECIQEDFTAYFLREMP